MLYENMKVRRARMHLLNSYREVIAATQTLKPSHAFLPALLQLLPFFTHNPRKKDKRAAKKPFPDHLAGLSTVERACKEQKS